MTQDLSGLSAGNYLFTVTDNHGCTQNAYTSIDSIPPMDISAITGPVECAEAKGNIDVTVTRGTPPYSYRWNTGATTSDLSKINSGTYSLTVKDANGCIVDTNFVIINLDAFHVTASGGGTIKLGDTAELNAVSTGSNQTVYNWAPDHGLNCPTCANTSTRPDESTLFTITAIDTNGCTAQDTISIYVISDHVLFVPNSFTPNGDGNNDYFQLFGNLQGINHIRFTVFDRWGEKVFETEQIDFKWDAVYKGEKLPMAVYIYILEIAFLDDQTTHLKKGSITLLR